jgi:hypothetical protein
MTMNDPRLHADQTGLYMMSARDAAEVNLHAQRGPTFKHESHLHPLFGGPYDWHVIDGRLTLRKRPPAEESHD